MAFLALAGCLDGGDGPPTPTDTLAYELEGLPDCAASFSDGWFCSGTGAELAEGGTVPDWMRPVADPGGWMASAFQTGDEFLCADDPAAAQAIMNDVFPQDPDYVSGVDDSDPRWLDVHFDDTGTAYKNFRVPRCSVFTRVANLGSLWPTSSATPRLLDPVWELVASPAIRQEFFDMAVMVERYRHLQSVAFLDGSVLYAMGSLATDTTWTLRTCRIGAGQSTAEADGMYRTGVWQSDYVMDVASGSAAFRDTDVRGVLCDHWIGDIPTW